ncbi:alpha/beta fold hydrolase [Inhella gelatinilytica]|uniref:Alpha/beta hydrolase n=1 Tax=Inhella gelatinilytica TaxID=2795030 RepID=A0A931NCQ2_9BURK|nr:alpha/beta hydrolase [Inhella gelatinilytica]MBH9551480.1 alpha/beta hydrolase [Inhella gelatinilytica]
MRIEIEPGVRLFVDVEGLGYVVDGPRLREKPTLILIHGGPGFDHTGFKPFFSQLADLAQVVYYDQRGHGRSDQRPASEWTLDTFADDVVRLCERLGIVKPIVLGQSFGGFVAQRYLARHPDHPARVILSSTTHHMGLVRKNAWFGRLGGPAAESASQAFWSNPCAETWATYEVQCRPHYNTQPQDGEARHRQVFRPEILFTSAAGEQQRMDLRPGLAGVRCPVLVMAGDTDPVTPIEDAEEIVAALPPACVQFERFANVGHGPWRDDPVRTLAVLRRFIGGEASRA